LLMELGNAALAENDLASAEKHFSQVVEIVPDSAAGHNNLAWALWKLKKPEARAHAEKANALKRDTPAYMDTLATILADEQKVPQAIELQARAVSMQPGNPALRLGLARLYMRAGDKSLARKELDSLRQLGEKFSGREEVERLWGQL